MYSLMPCCLMTNTSHMLNVHIWGYVFYTIAVWHAIPLYSLMWSQVSTVCLNPLYFLTLSIDVQRNPRLLKLIIFYNVTLCYEVMLVTNSLNFRLAIWIVDTKHDFIYFYSSWTFFYYIRIKKCILSSCLILFDKYTHNYHWVNTYICGILLDLNYSPKYWYVWAVFY